jgi:hypothetical protein
MIIVDLILHIKCQFGGCTFISSLMIIGGSQHLMVFKDWSLNTLEGYQML